MCALLLRSVPGKKRKKRSTGARVRTSNLGIGGAIATKKPVAAPKKAVAEGSCTRQALPVAVEHSMQSGEEQVDILAGKERREATRFVEEDEAEEATDDEEADERKNHSMTEDPRDGGEGEGEEEEEGKVAEINSGAAAPETDCLSRLLARKKAQLVLDAATRARVDAEVAARMDWGIRIAPICRSMYAGSSTAMEAEGVAEEAEEEEGDGEDEVGDEEEEEGGGIPRRRRRRGRRRRRRWRSMRRTTRTRKMRRTTRARTRTRRRRWVRARARTRMRMRVRVRVRARARARTRVRVRVRVALSVSTESLCSSAVIKS